MRWDSRLDGFGFNMIRKDEELTASYHGGYEDQQKSNGRCALLPARNVDFVCMAFNFTKICHQVLCIFFMCATILHYFTILLISIVLGNVSLFCCVFPFITISLLALLLQWRAHCTWVVCGLRVFFSTWICSGFNSFRPRCFIKMI